MKLNTNKKYFYPLLENGFSRRDISEGQKVLKTRFITMGKYTSKFEKIFAKKFKSKYAVMVNSGSSANLLAVFASKNPLRKNIFKNNDEALIPVLCWATSLWPLVQAGLKPKFVDIDPKTLNVDADHLISKINKKTKVIFLANANNPTGTFIPKDEVIRLHSSIPPNVLLVYDAAYSEFINHHDYIDGSSLVEKNENVIMLRTFSKLHGLASLRLGWGYCSQYIIDNLMKVRGPFSVNTPAIIAGIAAVEDIDFQKMSVAHNFEWRAWFEKQLKILNLTFEKSLTNFLLIKFPNDIKYSAQSAEDFLAKKGILVRGMAVYNLPSYLRVSIGTEKENITLINELKIFLEKDNDNNI